jgi:ssDNA-binding Zn-finger/Zn-ribbon topoisomerase 1
MSRDNPYYELRCRQCNWTEVCGTEGMVRWLRRAKKVRPGREPDLEILVELFQAVAPQLSCPECGQQGLVVGLAEADWPEERPCAACGKLIAPERLEAVPDATLCAACQRDEEHGRLPAEVEYCPKCGAPMALRPTKSAGVTRYEMVCTAIPPCRR